MHIEITSLFDLDVYTQKGVFVGTVDDAVLDPDGGVVIGLALGSVNKSLLDVKGKGIIVPFKYVTAIGDIVLVKHFSNQVGNDEKKY